MQTKKRRQQLLLSLIEKRKLSTQQELVEHLTKARVRVTQSSVSRDLEELGIIKLHGFYARPEAAKAFGPRGLLAVDAAGDALVVARCEGGLASAVTVEIDKAEIPEIVGTIAGDDTIFIAVKNKTAQKHVLEKIRSIFSLTSEESP